MGGSFRPNNFAKKMRKKKYKKMTRMKFVNSNPCLSVFFEVALIAMICVQWSDVV